jgi:hypothetical protein
VLDDKMEAKLHFLQLDEQKKNEIKRKLSKEMGKRVKEIEQKITN